MSTRANIIVTDGDSELIFYRHNDGYPKGALPTLEKFLRYVKEDRIRSNTGQAAGWLIVLGREEYAELYKDEKAAYMPKFAGEPAMPEGKGFTGYGGNDWKVGAIEPTSLIHCDIKYLYIVDLKTKEIRHSDSWGPEFYSGKFAEPIAA